MIGGLVRAELDRTASALGMVSGSDVARVSASLDRLERRMAALEAAVEEPGGPAAGHHGAHAPAVAPSSRATPHAQPAGKARPVEPKGKRARTSTARARRAPRSEQAGSDTTSTRRGEES